MQSNTDNTNSSYFIYALGLFCLLNILSTDATTYPTQQYKKENNSKIIIKHVVNTTTVLKEKN